MIGRCCVCDRPATVVSEYGEPFCADCRASEVAFKAARAAEPPKRAPFFDSSDPTRDLTQDEARAVCHDRRSHWCATWNPNGTRRSVQGAHVGGVRVGDTYYHEVGYVWSTPYSHYARGRSYTQVMGRGESLAAALIDAEKKHAKRVARAEGGAK